MKNILVKVSWKRNLIWILCLIMFLLFTLSIKSEIIQNNSLEESSAEPKLAENMVENKGVIESAGSSDKKLIETPSLQDNSIETNSTDKLNVESFYVNLDDINDSIDLNTIDTIQTKIPNATKENISNQNNTIKLDINITVNETLNVSNNNSDFLNTTTTNMTNITSLDAPTNITLILNETTGFVEEVIPKKEIDFSISTDRKQYFVNEPVMIIINAPDLMDVNVVITNNQDQYAYYYTGQKYPATYKFHLTNVIGKYTIKAVLFDEEPRTKSIEFEVLPLTAEKELSVHIDAETRVNQGDPVLFKAITWKEDDSFVYTWNFDDTSYDSGKVVSHSFKDPGIYLVSLNVSDGENHSYDNLVVHVTPIQYKLVVEVTNSKGKPISSSKVSLNMTSVETDTSGKAVFYVTPGFYNLSVQKKRFILYSSEKNISNNEVFTVILYDKIPILDSINQIKENNLLNKIEVRDETGAVIKEELDPEQVVDIVMTLESDKTVFSAKGVLSINQEKREFTILLHNVKAINANWKNSGNIIIETKNSKLERDMKRLGYIPKTIISLKNVEEVFYDPYYYGSIQFDIAGMDFNKLFYCKNDNIYECELIEQCFNNKYYGGSCYILADSYLTIYVPHFSSVLVVLDNRTANLNISSPDNSTPLISGEDIYLNFTINETVQAGYSFDKRDFVDLGQGTEFSVKLEGNLSYGILNNGLHNITINVQDDAENTASIDHFFSVNDNGVPVINVSYNNSDINDSIFTGDNNSYTINILSDEYVTISYLLNVLNFSDFIDLGENKSINLELELQNDTNILILNATDFHGNKAIYHYVFNYSKPVIKNITLNIATDKPRYNISDSVEIRVIVPQDATVTISVIGGTNVSTYTYTGPITYIYIDTLNTGTYSVIGVMIYNGNIQTKTITFEVVSPQPVYQPLSVSVTSDKTGVKEGETVTFTATVTGGKSPYTYKFDFNNDKTIDEMHTVPEQSKAVSYSYSTNGSYIANITVVDNLGNSSYAEKNIDVKKELKIIFIVKDNKTNADIEDVKITLNGNSQYTNVTGSTYFVLLQGLYDLTIQNENYYTHTEQLYISNNVTLTYKLNRTPESMQSPEVVLLSPINNKLISDIPVTFVYKAYDNSKMNCSLYISSGDGWWTLEDTKTDVSNAVQNSVELTNLNNGKYDWKVECIDGDGNTNSSPVYSFVLNATGQSNVVADTVLALSDAESSVFSSNEQESTEADIDGITSQIDSFKSQFYLFSADENEVANVINLEKILEKAKTELTRIKRDLNNIVFRRLNETGKEELKESIFQKIEDIKDSTPKAIKVIESHEFIKYPTASEIEDITKEILSIKNLSLNRAKLDSFVEENKELQKLITVLTKVKVVDIEYISERKVTYTLIEKNLQLKENLTNATFLEVIPKEFAQDLNYTEFYVDYEVIKKDPIVSIDITEYNNFAYFIKKRIHYKDAEKIQSIIISDKISEKGLSKITGFGVFRNFKPLFLQSSHNRLVIEITIVVILVIIYLAYSLNVFRNFDVHKIPLPLSKNNKMLREINNSIEKGFVYLKENKYEEAKGMYKKATIDFKDLPDKVKKNVKDKILQLCYSVDVAYISLLINQASGLISKNQKRNAIHLYKHITEVYKRIAPQYKTQVLKQCTDLYQKLK